MERLDQGDLHLAFERSGGSGDPVVLVHGGWDDHRIWDRVARGLAGALQVLAYDRRGHGESSGAPRARPVRDDAGDLAGLLEATGHYPAHVVGHGYGGVVALRLAVDRPELVRSVAVHEVPFLALLTPGAGGPTGAPTLAERLVLLRALAVGPSAPSAVQEFLGLFASPEEQWSALSEGRRTELVSAAPTWAQEMGDPEAQRPSAGELGGVAVPVLVTSGGRSPAFASQIGDALASALPNATALRLGEGGHFVPWTDPDLLVGVLGSFLLERNVPST